MIDVTDVSTVEDIPELLSSSSLFSMLLPLILAYIGPVAASVPKVREFFFVELAALDLDVIMISLLLCLVFSLYLRLTVLNFIIFY